MIQPKMISRLTFEHEPMLTVTVAKKEAKPAVEEKKHIAIEG